MTLQASSKIESAANLGFEQNLWLAAIASRQSRDIPFLTKRAPGRDISGLSAYEE